MNYPLPLSYIIDVNHDCNLDCRMCVKRTMENPHGQRSLKDFFKLVDKLPWAREISLGALGDPFLYKDIDKTLDHLSWKNIRAPLTTNATLITEETLKFIPIGTPLHISIDDGHIESHKSLDEVKNIIRMIRTKRQDLPIAINELIFKHSMSLAQDLINFCNQIGASIIFFYPMYFSKKLEKEWNIFRLKNFEDQLKGLILLCQEKKVPYSITSPMMKERICLRALNQPIIAFDGTVYPCDYIYQDIENQKSWKSWYLGKAIEVPQEQYKMGNLYEEDFIDMWNSKKWQLLRKLILNLNINGIGKSWEEAIKEVDLSVPFEHCKICLARWSRCL